MMLLAMLVIGLTRGAGSSSSTPLWVTNLLHEDSTKSILARQLTPSVQPNQAALRHAVPETSLFASDSVDDPECVKRLNEVGEAARQASQRMIEGRLEDAYQYLINITQERPDLRGFLQVHIAESALVAGHYDEAYKDLVVLVNTPATCNDQRYEELSLACAARGEVYPGQMEFCMKRLQANFVGRRGPAAFRPPNIRGNDSKSAMFLSAITLGMRGDLAQTYYLELALRLDPKCEPVAKDLVGVYTSSGQYSSARRVASNMVKSLPTSESHTWFVSQLDSIQGLTDKPLPRIVHPTPRP